MADAEVCPLEYKFVACAAQRTMARIGGAVTWDVVSVDNASVGRVELPGYAQRLGAEGWELASTTVTPGGLYLLVFTRPRM